MSDHRKHLNEYIRAGIECIKGNEHVSTGFKTDIKCGTAFFLGNFTISIFEVIHDVPCFGYLIEHPDMGKLVFVTDTEYIKYRFTGVNHIMVEANFSQDILDENMNSGEIPKSLRDRIMKSHMSFDTAKGMVEANFNPLLRNVVMCHLSSRNSDKKRFMVEMQEAAGPYCKVSIAKKGMEIDLNKYPF